MIQGPSGSREEREATKGIHRDEEVKVRRSKKRENQEIDGERDIAKDKDAGEDHFAKE